MKLSVWQQFSSNHSNGFTVVGVFKNEAEAKLAQERIHKFFEDLVNWWANNPQERGISQTEKDIAAEYGFEWEDSTDFIRELADAWSNPQRYKNIIEIQSAGDSWTSKEPYEILLQKLGAEVAAWDFISVEYEKGIPTIFMTSISGRAKNDDRAESFFKHWEERLTNKEAMLSRDGLVIRFTDFIFNIDLFVEILKSLEDWGFVDIQYKMEKEVFDLDKY